MAKDILQVTGGNGNNKISFPDDNQSPQAKENDEFGLEISWAIWGSNHNGNTNLFYNDRELYTRYKRFALGRQGEDQYKPFMNAEKGTDKKDWLKAIDFSIKNYATKRINIAVAKMHAKEFDITVEMNDPISNGIKNNIRRAMEIKMKNKKLLQEIDEMRGKKDISQGIPNDKEELEIIMQTDFKMVEAAHLEKAVPYHLERTKYEDERKLIDFDLAVLGVAGTYVGMDENVRPFAIRWNPADLLVPYMETPNYDKAPYIAGVKWVTGPEFRKLATGYLKPSKIDSLIDEYSQKDDYTYAEDFRRHDDIAKIPLLQYNYRSTDTFVHLEKEDDQGNVTVFEKKIDYYAKPKEMDKFKRKFGDSREIHRTSINAVYEGFWVIGSQTVFRHGRRAYSEEQFGSLGSTGMGFKVYAPNSWDGYITSMAAQMIPNLNELQKYNLKVQQLVARAIPKGVGIDLYALRKANLKWGGKALSDQEKIEMFMKSGIFAFSSKDRYAPGSNYKPFYEIENGLANDIEKYLRLIQNSLIELDEIIGINKVVAASNIREDAGKAVTELQVGASEVALDYLYAADQKIYKETVSEIGVLHMKSYRYSKKNRQIYDAMFGDGGSAQAVIRFDLFSFGFNIEVRPGDAEWQEIYLSAEKAYDKGILSYSDTLFLREFKSIKQARLWLMMKERQAQERVEASKQNDIQSNAIVQQNSLKAKSQADKELEMTKRESALILEESRRKTLQVAANIEIGKQERLKAVDGVAKRRQIAQEGVIKDRHIGNKGEVDITIAAMKTGQEEEKNTELDKK